ncbi:MAG TPA: DUF1800 domain-containing protein [Bryobacteraceae bacterium]|nr:DUF1800 domain-containing protein [Bryobacteraceae bacterium]
MRLLRLTIVSVTFLAAGFLFTGNGSGRFDTKLSPDQQILQALNRLTFGPRPGDPDEVRRLGIEKWVDLQLHPDRIPENPVLEGKVKPLETLHMTPAEILREYPSTPPGFMQMSMRPNDVVPSDVMRKLTTGTLEERLAVLKPLDPEKRRQALALVSPQAFSCMPELQKEAETARQAQNEERQKEFRRRMPPLNELLNQDQVAAAMRGNQEQLTALFAYLDPVKRQQVAAALPPQSLAEFAEMRRQGMMLRQPQQIITNDLREGKVFRALYTNRQLEEVLVDFWFNHFNVYEAKNSERPVLASFERDAIRPHVLGHFHDLLLATARHPAMLYYLDNWESMAPDALDIGPLAAPAGALRQPQRQPRGLNENYGRELMELHTLGVNGGYTQQDVIAVARAFSGWTIRKPNTAPEFVFAGFMHDTEEKVVLGHKLPNNGEQDGLQVIDILAHHPSTAKFISRKLAQRFVADDPPQSLVDRMAETFTKTDGDLRAVLQTMFNSTEFLSEGAWQAKMKSPLEMVVSSVRAMGADVTDTWALAQKVADLGEPLYGKVEPTGYPNTGDGWLNTAGIMGRMTFANSLASGQIAGVKLKQQDWEGKDPAAIARQLLGHDASVQTREALEKGLEGKEPSSRLVAGLVISSPDFQRR